MCQEKRGWKVHTATRFKTFYSQITVQISLSQGDAIQQTETCPEAWAIQPHYFFPAKWPCRVLKFLNCVLNTQNPISQPSSLKKKTTKKKQDQKQRAACGEMKRMFSFLFFHCLFPLTKQMPLYEFALGSATEELQGMRLLVQLEGPVRELFPSRLASHPASHSSTLSTQFWFYFFLLFLWLVSTTFMNNVQDARHEIWGMQTC